MMEAPVPSRPCGARRARLRPARLALLSLGLLLALAAPAAALAGEWIPQSSGVKTTLTDVEFVDASTGWAVGSGGDIVATTNGGATWVKQNSGTTQGLYAADFVDKLHGWAVGTDSVIVHTEDGGKTWVTQTTDIADPTKFDLYGVSFTDRQNGWACGYWGLLLATTDGGATWTRIVWPFGENVYIITLWHDILMLDAGHGWMVGEETIALAAPTPPWTRLQAGPSTTNLLAIDNSSATDAWAVGYNGAAFATSDGTTWTARTVTTVPADTHHHFLGVACVGPQVVHIASEDRTVYTSVDGGSTWQAEEVPTRYLLADIDFPDATHGWVVGSSGIIYTYSQKPFKPVAHALAGVTVTRGSTAWLPYHIDAATLTCKATFTIARKGKTVKKLVLKGAQTNEDQRANFVCFLPKGTYTWSVSAVDADGRSSNKSASKKLTVR
jgi:photosystem II stability/assembly factor-like uncharacterized protein